MPKFKTGDRVRIIRGREDAWYNHHIGYEYTIAMNPTTPHERVYWYISEKPKASGKSLAQTLKRITELNVKEGVPPAKDKVARAKDSSPTVEAGRVNLIRGPWNKEFIDQVCTFPNAAHDEYVDCLTMMIGKDKAKKKGVRRTN